MSENINIDNISNSLYLMAKSGLRNEKFETHSLKELTENLNYLSTQNKIDVLYFASKNGDSPLSSMKSKLTASIKEDLKNQEQDCLVRLNGNSVNQYEVSTLEESNEVDELYQNSNNSLNFIKKMFVLPIKRFLVSQLRGNQ